ncbi:MAG: preprotein translocase subunit SecE [Sphaerochaetaceae bacterium]|jgi:preprotein translocase subunit SecE|nr:preprotein translocase subunit SecE [Sphaerochaetaceae bacterium]MDD3942463.1 preprotein translocase subunit SecE [Sphaerochaetaceae bacterium]MDX9939423.1 preprotein translocase subunit SecE [Sphaerochaetaceae bacterium]
MKKLIRYFKESHMELKKVVWPTRDEVVASTKIVLVSTAIFALVLGLVDFLLVQGVDLIF